MASLPNVNSAHRAVRLLWSVCDLCRLSHPGHGTKQSSKGAGVKEQALSHGVVRAAVSGPRANLQIIASSGREVVEVGGACHWQIDGPCSIMARRGRLGATVQREEG